MTCFGRKGTPSVKFLNVGNVKHVHAEKLKASIV